MLNIIGLLVIMNVRHILSTVAGSQNWIGWEGMRIEGKSGDRSDLPIL